MVFSRRKIYFLPASYAGVARKTFFRKKFFISRNFREIEKRRKRKTSIFLKTKNGEKQKFFKSRKRKTAKNKKSRRTKNEKCFSFSRNPETCFCEKSFSFSQIFLNFPYIYQHITVMVLELIPSKNESQTKAAYKRPFLLTIRWAT